MLSAIAISNYRTLRDLYVRLKRLNVVTGANGSGKSNLYRSLRLLADIAQGRAIASLAREGGIQSVLWAGPEEFSRSVRRGDYPVQGTVRKKPVTLRFGIAGEEFSYAIDLGLPSPSTSAFAGDPEIKRECIWNGEILRPASLLVDRRGSLIRTRVESSEWAVVNQSLAAFDSMITSCADPRNTPEILLLRDQIRAWRFYDQFRTDPDAPARLPQVGTYTPVLCNDGSDLAAALQTIIEIGEVELLNASIEDAFPGSSISVSTDDRFEVSMRQHGLLRPLRAAELSEGTLRYLLWVAALLTPRPPRLLVLNEPETSLHPDLLPALARLIAKAAEHSQVIVVSHSPHLVAALEQQPECHSIMLVKEFGETTIAGAKGWKGPQWHWPTR
ncbi:MAG TPA: AAA family ATPase [Blastocatellia bacterium]|nr:AAA family ATPase [Blastocatellia bacterium]